MTDELLTSYLQARLRGDEDSAATFLDRYLERGQQSFTERTKAIPCPCEDAGIQERPYFLQTCLEANHPAEGGYIAAVLEQQHHRHERELE